MGYYEAKIEDAVFVVRADQQDAALDRMLELSADELGYDLADRGCRPSTSSSACSQCTPSGRAQTSSGWSSRTGTCSSSTTCSAPWARTWNPGLFHSGTTDRWRYVFDGGVDRRTEPPRPWYGR